jgi:hypothetical protein
MHAGLDADAVVEAAAKKNVELKSLSQYYFGRMPETASSWVSPRSNPRS